MRFLAFLKVFKCEKLKQLTKETPLRKGPYKRKPTKENLGNANVFVATKLKGGFMKTNQLIHPEDESVVSEFWSEHIQSRESAPTTKEFLLEFIELLHSPENLEQKTSAI